MKTVEFDVTKDTLLSIGMQYDHNVLKIKFKGYVPDSNLNTVFFKMEGLEESIPLTEDLEIPVTVQMTKNAGEQLSFQLIEITPQSECIKHSRLFKLWVDKSLDGSMLTEDSYDLYFVKLNELYQKLKSAKLVEIKVENDDIIIQKKGVD